MKINRFDRWLVAKFSEPQSMLSWAVYRGGRSEASRVVWCQVKRDELAPPVEPAAFLREKLEAAGMQDAVGMLTSANLDLFAENLKISDDLSVRTVTTVGMTNALRVGDPSCTAAAATINLLCSVGVPLTHAAHLEALSIAVEARTAAVMEANITSVQSGLRATGTGTDCAVLACPLAGDIPSRSYAGKHTELGSLIGQSVFEAVASGIELWKAEQKREISICG